MSYHRALGAPVFVRRSRPGLGVTAIEHRLGPTVIVRPPYPAVRRRGWFGQYESDDQRLGDSGDGLGGILAVL